MNASSIIFLACLVLGTANIGYALEMNALRKEDIALGKYERADRRARNIRIVAMLNIALASLCMLIALGVI